MSAQPALTREEWLAERKGYLGATDLAAIAGKHKYKTAVDVYLDKTGTKPDEASARKAQAGLALEPLILQWFEEDTGYKVKPGRLVRHPEFSFIACNLDGETDDGDLVEAKSMDFTTKEEWGEPGTDEIPIGYYVQAIVQLGLVSLERASLGLEPPRVNWIPRLDRGTMKCDVYAVYPDPEIFDLCVKAGVAFKRDHWDKLVPPAPTPEDADNLLYIYPNSTGEMLVSDPSLDEIASRMQEIYPEIKALESEYEGLKDRMKVGIGPAAGVETIAGKFTLCRMNGKVSWQKVAASLNPSQELVAKHTGEQFATLKTPFRVSK